MLERNRQREKPQVRRNYNILPEAMEDEKNARDR